MPITPLAPSTLQSLTSANANGVGKPFAKEPLTIDNAFTNSLAPQANNPSLAALGTQSTPAASSAVTQPSTDLTVISTSSPSATSSSIFSPANSSFNNSPDISAVSANTPDVSAPSSTTSADNSSPVQTATPAVIPASDSSASLYNAVASAGASTIRGVSVDLVA